VTDELKTVDGPGIPAHPVFGDVRCVLANLLRDDPQDCHIPLVVMKTGEHPGEGHESIWHDPAVLT
jgi:hypothetical protein